MIESCFFVLFPRKGLHQWNRRQDLVHAGGHLTLLFLLLFNRGLGPVIKMKKAVTQKRQSAQGDQTDLPIQGDHNGDHPDDRQQMGGEFQNRVREDVLQGVRIARDFGHQVARARLIVE